MAGVAQRVEHTPGHRHRLEPNAELALPSHRLGRLMGLSVHAAYGARSLVAARIILSLVPLAFQMLYVCPRKTGQGLFGLSLGTLTLVFVLSLPTSFGTFCGVASAHDQPCMISQSVLTRRAK